VVRAVLVNAHAVCAFGDSVVDCVCVCAFMCCVGCGIVLCITGTVHGVV
jgi:hypothetical protein